MKKIMSYIAGIFLAALIVHPIIDYRIPMLVNSWHWLFIVVMAALFGFYLLYTTLNSVLKIAIIYLFINCFFSQVPYLSFNAYVVMTFSFYLFLFLQKCDEAVILKWVEAAFWVQVCLSIFQIAGMDKLLCFDHAFQLNATTLQLEPVSMDVPRYVMFGTVMQYMRFASLLAILTPILILKDKRYLILIALLCVISQSSTFAYSLFAGITVYFGFKVKNWKMFICGLPIIFLIIGLYTVYDWGSFRGAILSSNGGRLITWLVILKTWVMDTAHAVKIDPWSISGPINWQWIFLGHGADTFLPLFPIYKHDINPFPQAHNSWLQLPWELGLIGLGLSFTYLIGLLVRLYRIRAIEHISGLCCIGVNMFFAFPDRMMQSCFLIIGYIAFCERKIKENL